MLKTLTSSMGLSVTSKGRRDRLSAFACCWVGLYSISYEYAAKIMAHISSRATASGGMPFLHPSSVTNGLWFVTKTNFLLYRYVGVKFFTANTTVELTLPYQFEHSFSAFDKVCGAYVLGFSLPSSYIYVCEITAPNP